MDIRIPQMNFQNVPVENFEYPDLLKEFYKPQILRNEQQLGQGNSRKAQIAAALEERYGAPKAEAELEGTQLGNENKRITNSYLDKHELAKIALMEAQARNQERMGRGVGGGRSSITDNMRRWQSAPSPLKQEMVAQLVGGGYTTDQAIKDLSEGNSIEDLLIAKGFSIDNMPNKIYATTTPNVTAMQNRAALSAGSQVIDEFITEASAPYARKFFGYSPTQVWESLWDSGDENQAKYLASRIMEDENAVLAVTKSGGKATMHAIDNMVDKSMGNSKIIPSTVSPTVYKLAKKYARDTLTKAAAAEREVLTDPNYYAKKAAKREQQMGLPIDQNRQQKMQQEAMQRQQPQQGAMQPVQLPQGMVRGILNGKPFTLPADKAQDFMNMGGQVIE